MIKMTDLKAAFEECGFENVVTYINSGNVAFDVLQKPARSKGTAEMESALLQKIGDAIDKKFGKQIAVMIREQSAITQILVNNPFEGQFESHKEMHVLFMKYVMPIDKADQLLAQQTLDERFVVSGREIYCHLRLGVADSLLGRGFIDKKLKISITGRNWRTVEKLSQI